MAYNHGVRVKEQATSLVAPVTGTAGLQVIIGTAPVNLAADPYKATNVQMIAYSFSEAVEQVGYSDDFKNYTLCQSMDACFRVLNVAPIILINVLDPKKHKKANEEQTVNVEKMQATVKVAGILADTVEVKANEATLTAGTDYITTFDDDGYLVITLTAGGKGASAKTLTVNSTSIDPTAVTESDIIGGYNASTGAETGMELIRHIYPKFSMTPGLLLAPGWTQKPNVGIALAAKCEEINGVFTCECILDIDTAEATKYTDCNDWKNKNGYTNKHAALLWPQVKVGTKQYAYSAIFGALTAYTDATNNKANTTAADLMDAFIGCGGAARAAGMNYKETSTALGILANNGIKGSEAGTALNSMLVRISTKDVAQKAFKDLGVAVYDSSGEMRNMRDILVDLNGAMAGMTQEQKNSYMSAIAGTNYYSQFGYLLDGVKEGVNGSASAWDELAGAIDNSTGALNAMDATATGTLQGALARFQSAISDLKISMVEDFGPYAMQIIDAVALKIPDITAGFSELIQKLPIQEFMNGVGQMAGGVLDFVEKIVDGQSFSEAFSSTLSEDFGVELPGSVQTFLGVIQNLWDDFQSFIGWIGSTAEATLGGLKDTIAEHEPQLQ